MKRITLGINSPQDLLDKLCFEAERLKGEIHPYDVFNFFITASVLYEWIKKHYLSSTIAKDVCEAVEKSDALLMPKIATEWIFDNSCIPNRGGDFRRDITNVIRACNFTANASKHYHWFKKNPVTAIEKDPQIKSIYQYFFTSTEPSLYVEIEEQYYSLNQIEGILLQFYTGLINQLESEKLAS